MKNNNAMTIYISLPITDHESDARERADLMKAALSRAGHNPVSPFDIPAGKNPDYVDHLCADLRALADCDAIMLCDGWQFSKGCRIEANFAKEFGKQFMYEKQPEADSEYYFNR